MLTGFFPPKPTAAGIRNYEEALVARFRPGAFDVAHAASDSAAAAKSLAEKFQATLDALDASHADRPTLQNQIDRLRAAAREAETVANTWQHSYRPSDEAAAFVRSSLDLQVAKAGGLLAFVAIAAAIAIVIWPTRVPPYRLFPAITFWSLSIGSLLSLGAILAHWGPHTNYVTPRADLTASLRFAALRSWVGNVATLASMVAAVTIAWWVAAGSIPEVQVTPPLVVPDSLVVRCEGRDALRVRGKADVDSLACLVRR